MKSDNMGSVSRSHRSARGFVVLVILLIVVSVVLAGALLVWILIPREPEFVIDHGVMIETRARLRELQTEFDSLPRLGGTRAPPADQDGCGEDSGDVFQPSATRSWFLLRADADQVAGQIANELRRLGWQGDPQPTAFGDYHLTSERRSWTARAQVTRLGGRVIVIIAHVKDARPCRLRDQEPR